MRLVKDVDDRDIRVQAKKISLTDHPAGSTCAPIFEFWKTTRAKLLFEMSAMLLGTM